MSSLYDPAIPSAPTGPPETPPSKRPPIDNLKDIPSVLRPSLYSRTAMLLSHGFSLEDIAAAFNLTPACASRLLKRPSVRDALSQYEARTLRTISLADSQRFLQARSIIYDALPRAALALVGQLSPDFAPDEVRKASTEILDRGGLTSKTAETHTGVPSEGPLHPQTLDSAAFVEALTGLVEAVRAPLPSGAPPPIPSHLNRSPIIDIEVKDPT